MYTRCVERVFRVYKVCVQLHSGCIQGEYRVCTGCVQDVFRVYKGCVQNIFKGVYRVYIRRVQGVYRRTAAVAVAEDDLVHRR